VTICGGAPTTMPSDTPSPTGGSGFKPSLKLHPASWVFNALAQLKAFLIPLLVAAVLGSSRDFSLWLPAIVLVPMVGVALWRQWIYRYGFAPDGLVIHEGLFFRNVRTIDYARIENVDTERGPLHRALNVADVRVETSTGGSAEARIRVLGLDAVEDMRARIFAQRSTHTADTAAAAAAKTIVAAEPEETLLALGPGELMRFGLIDNRGMILVGAALGVLAQGRFFENMQGWAGSLFAWLPWRELASLGFVVQVLLVAFTAAVLVTGTRVLSIVLAFTMLYDFRLTRAGSDLHTRYGLLTRVSRTLRRPRIQAVHQTATVLHRLFKRASLRVDLAGGHSAGSESAEPGGRGIFSDLWLAPLCPRDDAGRLIRAALPTARTSGIQWHTLTPRARWRIFRLRSLLWLGLALVPAAWLTGWWAAVILPAALPLFWLDAHLYVKHTGWALDGDFFLLKRGWWTRKLAVVRRDRIQSVRLSDSPFDRRYRMTQLTVDNAGAAATSHRVALPYLDRREAERLAFALYRPPADNGTMLEPRPL
jgi:putative membrane protein